MDETDGLPPITPSSISPFTIQSAPMTFGQILDRIYRLIRARWRLFCSIAAVPIALAVVTCGVIMLFMLPVIISDASATPPAPGAFTGASPMFSVAGILLSYPFFIAVSALYFAAAIYASLQADLGIVVSFSAAYRAAWSRFGRYLWLLILCFLSMFIPMFFFIISWGVLQLLAIKPGTSPVSMLLLMPLLFLVIIAASVFVLIAVLRLSLVYPACIEEDISAWSALKRSIRLTRGAMGRIFLVMLVIYAISYATLLVFLAACLAVGAACAAIGIAMHVTQGSPAFIAGVGLGILVYCVVMMAYMLFSYSAMTASVAVIYHDQKLREQNTALMLNRA